MSGQKGSVAGNVIAKLKNLVRPRWQRTLIDTGLEDQCGNLTVEGRDVVLRMLAQEAYEAPAVGDEGNRTLRQKIGEDLVKRNSEIKAEKEE